MNIQALGGLSHAAALQVVEVFVLVFVFVAKRFVRVSDSRLLPVLYEPDADGLGQLLGGCCAAGAGRGHIFQVGARGLDAGAAGHLHELSHLDVLAVL